MFLCVFSCNGYVMPLFLLGEGLNVNTDTYSHLMEIVVEPWEESIVGDRHHIFKQNGTFADNTKKMGTSTEEN